MVDPRRDEWNKLYFTHLNHLFAARDSLAILHDPRCPVSITSPDLQWIVRKNKKKSKTKQHERYDVNEYLGNQYKKGKNCWAGNEEEPRWTGRAASFEKICKTGYLLWFDVYENVSFCTFSFYYRFVWSRTEVGDEPPAFDIILAVLITCCRL